MSDTDLTDRTPSTAITQLQAGLSALADRAAALENKPPVTVEDKIVERISKLEIRVLKPGEYDQVTETTTEVTEQPVA